MDFLTCAFFIFVCLIIVLDKYTFSVFCGERPFSLFSSNFIGCYFDFVKLFSEEIDRH